MSWRASGDARCPYEASVEGERWQVRVNEFPEEPTPYSLLVAGEVVEELMAWPAAWTRPAEASAAGGAPTSEDAVADDPYDEREYELEQEKLARTRGIGPSKLVGEPSGQEPSVTKSVDDLFAEADADDAVALEEAEREAAASGKEPFSLARVEELLGQDPGAQAENEVSLRAKYYIRYPELRTLAELAALLRELDAWS